MTGVQTCALPISENGKWRVLRSATRIAAEIVPGEKKECDWLCYGKLVQVPRRDQAAREHIVMFPAKGHGPGHHDLPVPPCHIHQAQGIDLLPIVPGQGVHIRHRMFGRDNLSKDVGVLVERDDVHGEPGTDDPGRQVLPRVEEIHCPVDDPPVFHVAVQCGKGIPAFCLVDDHRCFGLRSCQESLWLHPVG